VPFFATPWPNSPGSHRQPFSGFAVEHDAVKIAFDRGKENIIQE